MRRKADSRASVPIAARWLAAGAGLLGAAYAAGTALAWYRYGRPPVRDPGEESDAFLDRFIPTYDVVEHHAVRVTAPAEVTFAVATELDLLASPAIRAIFELRRRVMLGSPAAGWHHGSFLAQARAGGWGTLAEVSGREVVMGAVTQPWKADVVFRSVPPEEFSTFSEPGYVKIAWTLRADAVSSNQSVFRTETRAIATDALARRRFRVYWACFSPGIVLIRWLLLAPLKGEAERRARQLGCISDSVWQSG